MDGPATWDVGEDQLISESGEETYKPPATWYDGENQLTPESEEEPYRPTAGPAKSVQVPVLNGGN
jgi:hypothetical protein